jgi:hypothetical protein
MGLYRRRGYGLALLVCVASGLVGCQRHAPPTAAGPPPEKPRQAAQGQVSPGPPSVPDGFVLRPTFETTLGKIAAGTAFPVQFPGQDRPLILTAIHLLGPAGGLPDDVPPTEVPRVVKGITLTDCFNPSGPSIKGGAPVVIPGAGPLGKATKAGDVLAFWGPAGPGFRPGRLAAASPAKGERVWLAASLREGAPPAQRLHAATVLGVDESGDLEYRYDNPNLSIRATSGAPVLNAAGEVVAINLGGGRVGKDIHGIGNPVGRFAPHLEAALGQRVRP